MVRFTVRTRLKTGPHNSLLISTWQMYTATSPAWLGRFMMLRQFSIILFGEGGFYAACLYGESHSAIGRQCHERQRGTFRRLGGERGFGTFRGNQSCHLK